MFMNCQLAAKRRFYWSIQQLTVPQKSLSIMWFSPHGEGYPKPSPAARAHLETFMPTFVKVASCRILHRTLYPSSRIGCLGPHLAWSQTMILEQDPRLWIQGSDPTSWMPYPWSWTWVQRFWTLHSASRILHAGSRLQDPGSRMQNGSWNGGWSHQRVIQKLLGDPMDDLGPSTVCAAGHHKFKLKMKSIIWWSVSLHVEAPTWQSIKDKCL